MCGCLIFDYAYLCGKLILLRVDAEGINESGCVMRYLCGYCKHHDCGKANEQVCVCVAKRQVIEHWYVACSALFKDRRESGNTWAGPERRKPVRLMSGV